LILRRFVNNIKKQDWFSVLLELVIVILGIYLGFQVTEWQANHEAEVAESRLLLRLGEDLKNLESENNKVIVALSKQLNRFEATLDFARNPDSWKRDYTFWRKQLQPIMGYPAPVVKLPVYEEIVATAQLSNIKNHSFRSALTRFSHKLNNTDKSNGEFLTLYGSAYQNIFNHLVDLQEFPERISGSNEDARAQLMRDLHTMKNTISLLRIFTKSITKQAKELRIELADN